MANNTNWLNISSQSGSSGQTILTLSANTNYDNTDKTAIVKAYNPVYNISATTTVSIFAYAPQIAVSPFMVGVPGSGGTYQLSISANCSYVISYPDMVSSYSSSAGTGDTNITFTVSGTSADTTIVGNIVITDVSGRFSAIVRVEQYGEGVSITYSPSALTIPFSGGSATFVVTANCIYNVNKGSGTWYTLVPQSGYTGATVFTVSSNTVNSGNTDWTDSITIVGPSGNVGTVSVAQQNQGSTRISYTADTSTVDASGETRTITIDATDFINSSITVTVIGAPGATYTYEQTSTTRGIITVNIPENTGSPRDVTVIVTGRRALSTTTASATIVFPQTEYITVPIPYTADTSTVDASGETRTITIDASDLVASSITIGIEGATGVTYTYENGVITVTFPANEGAGAGGARDITVTITGKTTDGNNAYASITYTQDYSYTGDTRVFVIYEQSYDVPTKISYTKVWSKVELADGTDITEAVTRHNGGGGGEWGQSGYSYNFGVDGYYGVYLTIPGDSIPNVAFADCYKIKLIDVPNVYQYIGSRAFMDLENPRRTIISLGGGLRYFGTEVFNFSDIDKLIFKSQTAPEIYPNFVSSISGLFSGIESGGTLFYPCGSDYSAYVDVLTTGHSWNTTCISETGTPSSSYTYPVYLLGNLEPFNGMGETRTFKVGCLVNADNTFSYSVDGPSGTSYTYSGDTITVTVPRNASSGIGQVTIYATATSYNGALVGTGQLTLEQLMDESRWTTAVYEVTSTTNPTKILGLVESNRVSALFPDGTVRTLANGETGYTFSSTGLQTVKYQMLETNPVIQDANILQGGMFYGVPNLKRVTVSSAITQITNGCFSNCDSLSAVTIPDSVTAIAFSNSSVAGQSCFENCPSLTGIVIPDSVVYLACYLRDGQIAGVNCGFGNDCSALTRVTIGSGISSSITWTAIFNDCTNLREIYMRPWTPPGFTYYITGLPDEGTVYYPVGSTIYKSWVEVLNATPEGDRHWDAMPTNFQ